MAAENNPVEIRDDREHGKLVAYEDGTAAGVIAYFVMYPEPGALVPVHTVVQPEYEGRGIGGALARELYTIAAREGVPVVPLCPYVVKWAQRHPDLAPAVPEEMVEGARRQLESHPELL
ncbi:GNAT family N-acetyltransferase [Streptomyces nitrosporeus]|uniref:N-acetyltransferase n=1 Tax=Streptomyces nitrosporeus TaxID=28894 RepID=A0A5J6F4H2_9ACTN|nr:GNAT family N-acetyltransferase [Streptomyces nitrosporeus]QEU70714.1 N-acetyltransferase [Streptomyces nitrosporeus]GGZ06559.1 N-acetyltransferase [Streptomyces nitrosporeus]